MASKVLFVFAAQALLIQAAFGQYLSASSLAESSVQTSNGLGLGLNGLNGAGLGLNGLNGAGLGLNGLNGAGLGLNGLNLAGLSLNGLNAAGLGLGALNGLGANAGLAGLGLGGVAAVPVAGVELVGTGLTSGLGLGAGLGLGSAALAAPAFLDLALLSGGGVLPISSVGPVVPAGLTVLSDNAIEGAVTVSGQLPFLSAVAFEGALASGGAGAASCGCGNGQIGILSETGSTAGALLPAAGGLGLGLGGLGGLAGLGGLGGLYL